TPSSPAARSRSAPALRRRGESMTTLSAETPERTASTSIASAVVVLPVPGAPRTTVGEPASTAPTARSCCSSSVGRASGAAGGTSRTRGSEAMRASHHTALTSPGIPGARVPIPRARGAEGSGRRVGEGPAVGLARCDPDRLLLHDRCEVTRSRARDVLLAEEMAHLVVDDVLPVLRARRELLGRLDPARVVDRGVPVAPARVLAGRVERRAHLVDLRGARKDDAHVRLALDPREGHGPLVAPALLVVEDR